MKRNKCICDLNKGVCIGRNSAAGKILLSKEGEYDETSCKMNKNGNCMNIDGKCKKQSKKPSKTPVVERTKATTVDDFNTI
jgi:hypothetical protein